MFSSLFTQKITMNIKLTERNSEKLVANYGVLDVTFVNSLSITDYIEFLHDVGANSQTSETSNCNGRIYLALHLLH